MIPGLAMADVQCSWLFMFICGAIGMTSCVCVIPAPGSACPGWWNPCMTSAMKGALYHHHLFPQAARTQRETKLRTSYIEELNTSWLLDFTLFVIYLLFAEPGCMYLTFTLMYIWLTDHHLHCHNNTEDTEISYWLDQIVPPRTYYMIAESTDTSWRTDNILV